jgi:hypothetical protein
MSRAIMAAPAHWRAAGRGERLSAAHLTQPPPAPHTPPAPAGSAFPAAERERLGLRGLLPPTISDMETQARVFRVPGGCGRP